MRAVNLVPQDQRRRGASEGDGKTAPMVLGVLGVLLVLVVVYVMTGNTATQRKSDAAKASAQADQLEARAGQQNGFTDFAQIAVTRTESVAAVAGTRFDWERFMRELSRVMPAGSWLQSADASVLGDPVSAGSGSPTPDPTVAKTPAANLVGCTPGQDDVARMMVRLRQLYRVDDVELNESTAGAHGEKASVDACGALYTFDLTVTFSAIGPSKEAPRGTNSVPASLGGGS